MSRAPRISIKPAVRQALAARFAAQPDHPFVVGVAGRLGYVLGQRGWPYPYAVCSFVAVSNRDTLTEQIDSVILQVMVFASDSLEAETLASAALGLFAGVPLHALGICDFVLRRFGEVPTLPDAGTDTTVIWQAGVTLAGLVQTKS